MSKRWIVIDIGCHECGVDSVLVGTYRSKYGAVRARNRLLKETEGWRDGGQSIPQVFEVEL